MKIFKIRIYPNKKQQELIAKHIGCCRFVYNWALAQKIQFYQEHNTSLHKYELTKRLPQLKKELPWLEEVLAASLQLAIFKLDETYKKFFKGAGFPKFQSKKKACQSYAVPQNIKLNLKRKSIQIPKLGWMRFRDSDRIKKILKIKTTYILKSKTNKYYACLCVELPSRDQIEIDTSKVIGIDLGLHTFATFSDGTKIKHPETLKKYLPKIQEASSQYSKDKTETNRLKLASLYEKVTNCRMDFLQKLTSQIAENQDYHVVCIEDLSIQDIFGKVSNINRKIADSCWYKFRELLRNKLIEKGKQLIVIGRFEPSSKTCTCGKINNKLTVKQHQWICESCGIKHDRDILAANNIKRWGTPSNIQT